MANGNGTSGHEQELVNVQDLKATLKKSGNKGLFNIATCSTAAGTAAKTVNAPLSFSLEDGAKIIVEFSNGITVANATLQVGETSAKPIYFRGAPLGADVVKPATSLLLSYNGTVYNIIGSISLEADFANEKLGNGIGTCSTSSGTALEVILSGYRLVENGFVAVTFANDVPANATLNINSRGAKPIICKGSAIEADTIKADDTVMFCYNGTNYVVTSLGGEGSSVALVEYLSINLTSDVATPDPALLGATVVVTDEDNSETILSTTWQGTTIECEIPVAITYTITVGAVQDYITPSSKTFKAKSAYQRTVNLVYFDATLVDFGLPSGVRWRKYNLGANSETGDGLYFTYGNISGTAYGDGAVDGGTSYANTKGGKLTASFSSGDPEYDAARAILGGSWRMPTTEEMTELINNTSHQATTKNGVVGVLFSRPSYTENTLFFPASGYKTTGTPASYGSFGYYRTTEYISSGSSRIMSVNTSNGNAQTSNEISGEGYCIKAVK